MNTLSIECRAPDVRRAKMEGAFRSFYGTEPTLGTRAPGRVDLMGSHTDYNDGCVLTLPVNRETWILASPRDDGKVRIASLNLKGNQEFQASSPESEPLAGWGRYIQGVAVALHQFGYPITGFDGLIHGTIPLASGLSSSASLEAAAATLFEQLGGFVLDPVEKAGICQRAENSWVGVNCGILDQYSSILGEKGKALLLDCRSLTHEYADFPPSLRVVICDTCAPRELDGSEYGQRRTQCETGARFFARLDERNKALRDVSLELFERHESALPEEVARRCRFIIEENARVFELADALQFNKRDAIDRITRASFAGARDLFEISVPAMLAMYDAMRGAPGQVGCRQAGAGFGGCMLALVDVNHVKEFCKATDEAYRKMSGVTPSIFEIHTAPGAGKLF